jgi:FkbM family methyltransferase
MRSEWDTFAAFVASAHWRSRAQLFQDLWVLWETQNKTNGYFVEIGAADGVKISNTYLLEQEFSWNGILVEPLPDYHQQISSHRTAILDRRAVWSKSVGALPFVVVDDPDFSSLQIVALDDNYSSIRKQSCKTIDVETVSLSQVLAENGAPVEIDYLSIDTEGAEYQILETFDFERYNVKLISVEHNYNREKRHKILEFLMSRGFERALVEFSCWDDWYVFGAACSGGSLYNTYHDLQSELENTRAQLREVSRQRDQLLASNPGRIK